jgi:CubicO group peptidase (beta-lactamase class C family)
MIAVPTTSRRTRRIHLRAAGQLLLLLAWLLLPGAASGQVGPDLRALDEYIERSRLEWGVPGLAIAIVKDGRLEMAKGFGVREVGTTGRVDEHTLFAVASNTKAFAAAALAVLVDEGRVHWDDRVRSHLPYFELYDPYVTSEMRLRDLLSHRSGLGTFSGDLVWYGTGYDAAEVVRRARYLSPAGPFRAHYGYSNIMFVAAGEVVPAVTGMTWSAFVRERFLDPLGMSRTVLSVRDLAGMDNVATPHGVRDGAVTTYPWYAWDAMTAAGGMISSVSDMARWLRLQLGRGTADGRRYYSEAASREMWHAHTPIPIGGASAARFPTTHFRAYGLGWSLLDYHGRKMVTHSGGYDGMFSRVALVPEIGLGIVVLTNSMTDIASAITYRVVDGFLGAAPRDWSRELLELDGESRQRWAERQAAVPVVRTAAARSPLPLGTYAGTFAGPFYGAADVTLEGGALVLRLLPNPDLVADLRHLHGDTFVLTWRKAFPWFDRGRAHFTADSEGRITRLRLEVPNDDFWFEELDLVRDGDPGAIAERG